jgi:hypothetical protein
VLFHSIAGLLIPDILKEHTASIFMGQEPLEPLRWRWYVPSKCQELTTLLLTATTENTKSSTSALKKPQIL